MKRFTHRVWAFLAAGLLSVPLALNTSASVSADPGIPDVGSLIDFSGPVPTTYDEMRQSPSLWFTAPNGLLCNKGFHKAWYWVTCTGNMPGAPADSRAVSIGSAGGPTGYFQPSGYPNSTGQTPAVLPVGHKFVFYRSPTESLTCGVPSEDALACVLWTQADGSHGFEVTATQSRVF